MESTTPTSEAGVSTEALAEQGKKLNLLAENLARVIRGKPDTIDTLLVALLANGSVLMEDVPGVGKTTLAKALAKSIDVDFRRVQFTPDLLPSDILGSSIYNPVDGTFYFREGPVFCNILLADEINRASPRTQSALLEAMSEGQATIDGDRHALPSPFLVLATQNPVDFHGTYPLPEAQMDRFLIQLNLGYPDQDTEVGILFSQQEAHPIDDLSSVLTRDEVSQMQTTVRKVKVEETVAQYMIELVQQTRTDARLTLGVSPRGSLMLFRACQAAAFAAGRDFVMPDDVQKMAPPVLSHRLILTSKTKYANVNKQQIVSEILSQVRVPT
ncbi:MAG: magnesium chelatase [Planctomycetaceae bacterium]|nr:magnesium chelatase [Planctomycetaceae bacterium]